MQEALRINERYLTEIVEAFDICPFARSARTGGALARRVLLDETPAVGPSLVEIEALAGDAAIEVAVLLYPRLSVSAPRFDEFVAELRRADGARRGGTTAPFALAMFHPEASYGRENPQRLMMFFRRTPDPTIQLVRFSVLDAVKRGAPTDKFVFDGSARAWAELERRSETMGVSDRIAHNNFATVERQGLERLEAVYRDIAADRARSYARVTR